VVDLDTRGHNRCSLVFLQRHLFDKRLIRFVFDNGVLGCA
jgi:hypothetical protein